MPDFVGENADEFFGGVVFDEGVEEGNALGFTEAGEVGIGFGGAFRAVDLENAAEGIFLSFGKFFDGGAQLPFFERGEFVEERQDDDGRDEHDKELDGTKCAPCP